MVEPTEITTQYFRHCKTKYQYYLLEKNGADHLITDQQLRSLWAFECVLLNNECMKQVIKNFIKITVYTLSTDK